MRTGRVRTDTNSFRIPIMLGFVGSSLTAVGSYGVGWLGPTSMIIQWPLVAALRASVLATIGCTAAVTCGVLLLIVAWLWLGRTVRQAKTGRQLEAGRGLEAIRRPQAIRRPMTVRHLAAIRRRAPQRSSLAMVVIAATAWTLPLILAIPLFSRDVFAYVGQGRVAAEGYSPYQYPIATVAGWFGLGVDPLWSHTLAPYGPVFIGLEHAIVEGVGVDSAERAILLFRLLAVVGLAIMGVYAYKLAHLRGLDPAVVLWWTVASPLALMTLIASAHNDALMLALILAGVYYARTKPALAILLVSAAIGIKPIAVIALPIVGLIWAGPRASWRRRIVYWMICAAASAGILAGLSFVIGSGFGFGWLPSLLLPTTIPSWYSPSSMLAFAVGMILSVFGLHTAWLQDAIKAIVAALGAAGVVYAMVSKRAFTPTTRMALAFSFFLIFSPTIYPWYVVWVLVMWALVGIQTPRFIQVAAGITIFLCCTSLAEPMDSPVLGTAAEPVRAAAIAFVFAAAAAILVTFVLHGRHEKRARSDVAAPAIQSETRSAT